MFLKLTKKCKIISPSPIQFYNPMQIVMQIYDYEFLIPMQILVRI